MGSKDPSRPAGCVGEGGRSAGWRRRQRWVGGSAGTVPTRRALRSGVRRIVTGGRGGGVTRGCGLRRFLRVRRHRVSGRWAPARSCGCRESGAVEFGGGPAAGLGGYEGCACGVGGFLGVLSGLCCDGDGFAVCVECVAEFCYQGDACGEEVLRGGAFVGLRCGHDGETPGPLVLAGAPSLTGRRAHARTTDCSCPQRGGVGAAATTKAHPTAWRAAGWSSLAGIIGGRGRLGVRVCSGVCAPASRAIWYGCGPTTRSKMLEQPSVRRFGLDRGPVVGHTEA